MDYKTLFAIKLKQFRKARKLTQLELAEMVDRSVETISQIEREKFLPSVETLKAISDALDVPIGSFFDDEFRDGSRKRSELLAQFYAVAAQLDEQQLKIALMQIKAFENSETVN